MFLFGTAKSFKHGIYFLGLQPPVGAFTREHFCFAWPMQSTSFFVGKQFVLFLTTAALFSKKKEITAHAESSKDDNSVKMLASSDEMKYVPKQS